MEQGAVPAAEAVAREYVLLGLRCGRVLPGLVDAYTGPAAVRRRVADEPPPHAGELAKRAALLRAELPGSGLVPARREFLDRQLAALECAMARADGRPVGYAEELRAYFDLPASSVRPGDQERYLAAHAELAEVLPAGGPLAARMAVQRKREEMPSSLVGPAMQALSAELRALTSARLGLPPGEAVFYELAIDRPWSGFNHYAGGFRSRVALDAEQARRAPALARLVAHEAYPGHHTERCRREAVLVASQGQQEHTLFLLNTPQCLISEGLAELALPALVGAEWGSWVEGVLAGLGFRLDGELAQRVAGAVDALAPVRLDAALMLHRGRADADAVVNYLRRWLLVPEPRARRMLRFIGHPLWRAYTATYVAGPPLLRAWLDARPAGQPSTDRFRRLLDEPLTPSLLRAELSTA
ncbi:hypothetical protein GCM10023321_19710 [Pseudonocardia eucalypti]|uniref:DUF885 domain-containing protein n=1 Tax=Pseudonocardia eucalypti TaxID=648755 RepID=A0ABP9PWH3_9PSEU|nr:hypothetical protein [Pseudonocardia eucalypti]